MRASEKHVYDSVFPNNMGARCKTSEQISSFACHFVLLVHLFVIVLTLSLNVSELILLYKNTLPNQGCDTVTAFHRLTLLGAKERKGQPCYISDSL